jgi:uncharacterized delta-60 repeat protein
MRAATLAALAVTAILPFSSSALAGQPLADFAVDAQGRATVLVATSAASKPVVLRLSAAGVLDPSFAKEGILRPPLSGVSPMLAVQPGGGLIVGGNRGKRVVLLRYRADGTRDVRFGQRGTALVTFGGPLESVMLQPRGQIVALGTTSCTPDFCGYLYRNLDVMRYTASGKLLHEYRLSKEEWFFHAAAVDSRGGFMVAGRADDLANETFDRFRPSGAFAGEVHREVKIHPRDELELEPSVNALVVEGGGGFALTPSYGAEIWRRGATGRPDLSFGERGRVECTEDGGTASFSSLLAVPQGKLVAAGGWGRCSLVRYLANGSPDPSFGEGGFAAADSRMPRLRALAVLPDGGLMAAGWDSASNSVRVVRYTAVGLLDRSYGVEGVASVNLGEAG